MVESVISVLEERKKYLISLSEKITKALRSLPGGSLRINHSHGRTQYYHRKDSADRYGRYISHEDMALAEALAQKNYYEKLMVSANSELKAIDALLKQYPHIAVESVHEQLTADRKEMVIPIHLSDEDYAAEWRKKDYVRKEIPENYPKYFTGRGERVRSKSEVIIAAALDRAGVPYRYEEPLYLEGMGQVHPDFTALNVRLRKEIRWEHQGMMDDPGYANDASRKVSAYIYNGYFPGDNLIITTETSETPLNTRDIDALIKHFLL